MGLPGIDISLDQNSELPFEGRTGDWNEIALPVTVRERVIIAVTATLKDKPDWERKVFDEAIVSKWRSEALANNSVAQAQDQTGATEHDHMQHNEPEGAALEPNPPARQRVVTEKLFQFCIDELRDQAAASQENGFTEVMEANAAVYIADEAVGHETKTALQAGVSRLEEASDNRKDWHPGSDGKVLDIVHPSLFPLMYGKSKFLHEGKVPLETCSEYSGLGETVPIVDFSAYKYAPDEYSTKHQWLPCDVSIDPAGGAHITSYINNLHPDGNHDLYAAIEQVLSKALPMWKMAVRSTLYRFEQSRLTVVGDGYDDDAETRFVEARSERRRKRREDRDGSGDDGIEDHEDDSTDDDEDEGDRSRFIMVPEPDAYKPRQRRAKDEDASTFDQTFSGNNLQVIVKLANIHLTPEKPGYDGGSWHIEGLPNEHICASALYYYDSSNVTDSHLAFRETVNEQFLSANGIGEYDFPSGPEYMQDEYGALMEIYGLDDRVALQILGQVLTKEDRLLVFPNVLQHRVSPFKLADSTKPGHRKLLALFLVDPNIPIPSTANVPPQQLDWWAKQINQEGALKKLPQELADRVYDEVHDFPLSMEQAKQVRDELMEERKAQLQETENRWQAFDYSFCEH